MSDKTFTSINDDLKIENILTNEYKLAIDSADSIVQWYIQRQQSQRVWSKALRALAIISAAVGTICPLIDSTGILKSTSGNNSLIFGQWGYIAFALAGAFVGADKFFGVSSGWMRYMLTRLEIERIIKEFKLDWTISIIELKDQQDTQHIKVLLQRIKSFVISIQDIVKKETECWASEFQSNLTELEKMVKKDTEAAKPGDIAITLNNAVDFDNEFILSFPGRADEQVKGSSTLISAVPPGNHVVRVTAKKGEKISTDAKVVEIKSGKLEKINFDLKMA